MPGEFIIKIRKVFDKKKLGTLNVSDTKLIFLKESLKIQGFWKRSQSEIGAK